MNVLEKILEEIEEKFKTADAEKCDCEELCDVEDWYDSGYIDGQLSAHEKCMDIIRSHMNEAENDGWIPVEEKLPDNEEENVLVVVNGKYKIAEFKDATMLGNYSRRDKDWCIEGWEECENLNVTAWQPLPEPYKPKEKVTISKNSQQELEDFWMDR